MLRRLPARFALRIATLAAFGALSLLWTVDAYVRSATSLDAERRLSRLAASLARDLAGLPDVERAARVEQTARAHGVRVRVTSPAGVLLEDTADRSERSITKHEGQARTAAGELIRVAGGSTELEAVTLRTSRALGASAVVFVLALTLGAFWTGRRESVAIREMNATLDAVRSGKLEARTRSRDGTDLAELAARQDAVLDQLVAQLTAALEEEARLRTVLDSMVEGVFVTDREGRVVRTNRALSKIGAKDAIGRTAIEVVRSPELHEAVAGALAGDARPRGVEFLLPQRGKTIAAQVSTLSGGTGAVAVLHDVTELRRADQVRRDFVANASHELRTPLAAIRGYAETLRDGAVSDPELATRFSNIILEHSMRLERLVNDLLELSRAESLDARGARAPVELLPVVEKAARGLEVQAAARKIDVVLDLPAEEVVVLGDEVGLEHVVGNLVDNAIKYHREGGRVTVRCRRVGDRVVLEVSDTGPGIAAVHLPRIFERFYRVDPGRSRAAGGTGLGLAIVRHHVLRMGGEVTVESTVGTGTTFRVRLRPIATGDSEPLIKA